MPVTSKGLSALFNAVENYREYFAKISKNANRKHTNICHVSITNPSINKNEILHYLSSSE